MNADRVSNPPCGADVARREWLSALFDGESAAVPTEPMVLDDTDDATWDAYRCIGEALRAHAAAQTRAADPVFVRAVMARINQEPRFEAPRLAEPIAPSLSQPPVAANDAVFRWKMVAAIASLAAVLAWAWQAGGVVGTPAGAPAWVRAPADTASAVAAAPTVPAAPSTAYAPAAPAARHAQLEELLAAHRQWGGASALQSSAGFLRTASVEAPAR
ncbi:RseA family anti-sigma factor [Tepidimonas charontis]|uniref:Anti sigma-E protein RseA N-terminal domain-containing protein n=1 Tax=Tepidimonas charontis TaxID=2267262 RepID=A0A554XJP0_9BURK|nr:RseA family anti-sigma factor [Tepidimonas charontis]TSE36042.1 hypothetical protein Tchar_00399 [Tepidimonas charontis]